MKKRQSTVEPVIGTLINYQGMKKVHTKGLKQANKCLNYEQRPLIERNY